MEILAGGMDDYFKRSGINAKKVWEGKFGWSNFQIWEMHQELFKKLQNTGDESYMENEWWRSADGSNMGPATKVFTINGKEIKAWDAEWRDEYDEEEMIREYDNLAEYFSDELGCEEARNVVSLVVDLAKENGMTMEELFELCQGE